MPGTWPGWGRLPTVRMIQTSSGRRTWRSWPWRPCLPDTADDRQVIPGRCKWFFRLRRPTIRRATLLAPYGRKRGFGKHETRFSYPRGDTSLGLQVPPRRLANCVDASEMVVSHPGLSESRKPLTDFRKASPCQGGWFPSHLPELVATWQVRRNSEKIPASGTTVALRGERAGRTRAPCAHGCGRTIHLPTAWEGRPTSLIHAGDKRWPRLKPRAERNC